MNNIISLDLASRQTGFAIFGSDKELIKYGIIAPLANLETDQRLPVIEKKIKDLLVCYAPKLAILELPVGGGKEENYKTMSILFMVQGVIRNLLIKEKIKYELISPSSWQFLLGIHKRDRISRKAGAKEYSIKKYALPENLEQDIYDAVCLFDCYQIGKEEESAF